MRMRKPQQNNPRPPAGAVVTGAGRGLGREIATLLARRGYTVVVTDVDESLAEQTAAEIGSNAVPFALDVRDEAACRAAAAEAVARGGRLDVWVNNAGVLFTGPVWEHEEASRRLMIEVNAIGTMNGTLSAIGEMRRTEGGHIVNIVSLAGLCAVPGEAAYAASKHAALGFGLSTQADLKIAGIDDIKISSVCPDGIWTPMLYDKLEDPGAALSFGGKLLQVEEVVAAVDKVLDRPRQVTTVPGWRAPIVRLADALPDLALAALPLAVEAGRRTQRKLLKQGVGR